MLFNQNFSPYKNIVTTKASFETKLTTGLLFYDLKLYDSALVYFKEGLQSDSLNQDLLFYLATAYLSDGKVNKAIILYDKIQKNDAGKYAIPSKWFLGLAYLQTGDKEKAAVVFREILHEKNFYSTKAGKILKKLN